ncbi:hypothetical protein ACOMHN_031913 [Nucella lapillus]
MNPATVSSSADEAVSREALMNPGISSSAADEAVSREALMNPATSLADCNLTCDSTTDSNCKISGISFNETKPRPQHHYCLFCDQPQARLPRHLETVHRDEKSMVPYLNAKGSSEKRKEMAKLRNAGDHQHNIDVLKKEEGHVVVKRRKRDCSTAKLEDFIPCPDCYGYFQKADLYRHKCVQKNQESRRDLVKRGKLLLPDTKTKGTPDLYRAFFNTLSGGAVSLLAKTDSLIRDVAAKELKTCGFNKDKFSQVRNKARELAQLLVALRQLSKDKNGKLSNYLKPERFNLVIAATKQAAGYDENKFSFATPSLATKLGNSLMTCAMILEARAVETTDEVLLNDAKSYILLHKARWHEEVSAHARRTLIVKSTGHQKRLPLSQDVAKLARHLSSVADETTKNLSDAVEENVVKKALSTLAEVTLTQVILFNRRRSGEASKLKVDLEQQTTHDPGVKVEHLEQQTTHDPGVKVEHLEQQTTHDPGVKVEHLEQQTTHDPGVKVEHLEQQTTHDPGVKVEHLEQQTTHDPGVKVEHLEQQTTHDPGVKVEHLEQQTTHDPGVKVEHLEQQTTHDPGVKVEHLEQQTTHDPGVKVEQLEQQTTHDPGVKVEHLEQQTTHDPGVKVEHLEQQTTHDPGVKVEHLEQQTTHDPGVKVEHLEQQTTHDPGVKVEHLEQQTTHDPDVKVEHLEQQTTHDPDVKVEHLEQQTTHDPAGMQRGEKETTFDPSSAFTQPPPADGPAFPPDLQSAVGNAPLSSKHPTHLPTTDCLLSITPLMGGQPSDAPALSPPSPLQQGGQSSNAPALSPPSPLPQGSQPIALALSPSSPLPQDGQPSDAPGLSPSSSTLLLCPSDSTLSICHLNSQSAVKTGKRTFEEEEHEEGKRTFEEGEPLRREKNL